ncbi:cleavage polyadenylation factor subunit fip1 [Fusarium falciforme]|nr:cleavage polyadenylation factor subunit fip1 [Fusarium falciforme]KAJ4208774.1 cleavage polyadenylation factor subunit fip1 [Fusarium falciforme]KAJ4238470.1 cleavage polyadenylation factor subunit fip1 [Fusarium falciforme]
MVANMDIDEDDDLYVPEEPKAQGATPDDKPKADDLEEGEEEDEGAAMDEDDDDSDIDIITERKDGTKPAPPSQSKYSDIRNIPQRSASNDSPSQSAPVKKEGESRQSSSVNVAAPSADKTSAAASKSTIDVNAIPVHAASGKPITQVNIDEDLPENDKPWRKPGTDISDYFNYGFDEFTWALYAAKQEAVRGEFGADVFAQNNKKMMDEFNMMMMGGMAMPGGGSGGNSAAGMPGMDGMPPEMQAMMQQMMASGMDPSQMDPSQMNAMFAGMQNAGGAGGQGSQGGQGGNFGGGFGGNQSNFGYEQNMSGGGGGGGRGGFGGGRGRRGRW